jgi:PIN domain nuclease of toxin-antitoxin system
MKRYYIDTCVLIWLFEDNKHVRKVADDMKYYQGDFAVSINVLQEFANLLTIGKIEIKFTLKELFEKIAEFGIEICPFEKKHLKYIFELPYFTEHGDQNDRNIIAHAIADKRILISGDTRFSLYETAGLNFLGV